MEFFEFCIESGRADKLSRAESAVRARRRQENEKKGRQEERQRCTEEEGGRETDN